ncbi:sensor histidine kinase [Aureivirga marina]|uniref:sensor histidine kinase n=1 Tax=Aureivirga marina TaxID=1182451 RepID=UPI0018CB549B|nr:histidine kinase [Aureivirga marina]
MKVFKKHIIIWIVYTLLLFSFYEFGTKTSTALTHTFSFVGNQIFAFYLNHFLFLPKLFEKKKYFLFSILNILLICFGTFSNTFIENLTEHKYENSAFEIHLESLYAHALPSVIAIFVAFILYTYYKRLQQEQKELELVKSEKNFLIQQINPHFLFNTLNNIYSLTMENNPKGSEAILQLSKMLDYSLYGNKTEKVNLQKEIFYIQNFIHLFKLKDEEIKNIAFNYKHVNPDFKIAPMLLLPFIENAFKHGNIENISNGKIEISLKTTTKELEFICKNTFVEGKKVDRIGGIGITNVSRRLELLYPNAHKLDISKKENVFEVTLKIKEK